MLGAGGNVAPRQWAEPDPILEDEEEGQRFERLKRKSLFRALQTSAFRYIIFAAALFVVGVVIIGYVVYDSTIGEAFDRVEQELSDELDRLERIAESEGAPNWSGFTALVVEAESNKLPVNTTYMIWLDYGTYASRYQGNLEGVPVPMLRADGAFEFSWARDRPVFSDYEPRRRRYLGLSRTLTFERIAGGPSVEATIVLARDIDALYQLSQTRTDIATRVIGVTLFIAVVLGIVLGRSLITRLDAINRSVEAITEGDLTRRLPSGTSGDEYDNLARNINLMLDRIEQLMTGMKQVSDNIAHDLRSPLTRIKARLDSTLNDIETVDAEERAEVLLTTRGEVERLLKTFNALLSITRIEAGSGALAGTVDIRAVAEEMLELYIPAGDDEGVEIVGELQDVPEIHGSRELISQAIANLLDNALKYARHPEEAGIKTKIILFVAPRPTGGVIMTILDNGPGVSEMDRERITQRFVRLERSRSTQGNGLGLSLVSAIVRRHGGRMTVGRGLPHQEAGRSLTPSNAYGLGIRIAFPGIKAQPAKKSPLGN
ncbi:HAMP domain-containing histidine kinase [Parvularcula sp. ZS-1/3]|uniref:histidine kinase n=1 Tax=Parvularcula mediterranea TaxID=2732508 RepID=A0A7Y3W5U3_9PROT|nr:HAMP domain-containing sensor histidine kinase [Parvularcula mediterranea]NNU16974.1 HAMP domain-containing histidine kinase [Parvularcula mediterranea]